jgi:hypothetical protein
MPIIYTTAQQVEIHVERGSKSPNDFIVRYRESNKRVRTPKHIHLVVDLFAKRTSNLSLTNDLVDHIIQNIILKVTPSVSFPPSLQIFKPAHVKKFQKLSEYGEYSIEFLLVMTELIMIQEKTNYPNGTINLDLFQKLRDGADIFSIVSAATFR